VFFTPSQISCHIAKVVLAFQSRDSRQIPIAFLTRPPRHHLQRFPSLRLSTDGPRLAKPHRPGMAVIRNPSQTSDIVPLGLENGKAGAHLGGRAPRINPIRIPTGEGNPGRLTVKLGITSTAKPPQWS